MFLKKSKPTLFILTIITYLLLTGCSASDRGYSEKYKSAQLEIAFGAESATKICEVYSQTWEAAIENGNDFNQAIKRAQETLQSSKAFEILEETKAEAEKKMKDAANPPKSFEEPYKKLVQLYGIYGQLNSLAMNPSGTLMSFNQKVNDLSSQFISLSNEISVLVPETEQ